MGCAESKLDVVSGNTIFRRKKSNPNPKKSKDIETIHETTSTSTKDNTANSSAKVFDGAVLTDAKDSDIPENTAAKEGNHHDDEKRSIDQGKLEGVDVEEKEAAGRLISHDSPNHYFSPRKNDIDHLGISIDGINVSEGRRSIESDYYSPSHAAGKEDHNLLSENVKADDAVEGKELAEDNELTKEVKENVRIGEPVKVEEEKVIKDAEPKKTIVETKVSNPNSDQEIMKNYATADHQDQEINKVDTPTKDEISKK